MNTRDAFWGNNGKTCVSPFIPRIPELQALNGIKINVSESIDHNKLNALNFESLSAVKWLFQVNRLNLRDCIVSGKVGEKKLGKWLTHSHIPEDVVSQVCAAKTKGTKLTFTTRYKDFARLGHSKHYLSCATTDYKNTSSYYLHKPNVFMLVDRGDNGDFKTRVIGRLTRVTKDSDARILDLPSSSLVILFNRIYGVSVPLPEQLYGIPCFAMPDKGMEGRVESLHISETLCEYEAGVECASMLSKVGVYDDLLKYAEVVRPSKKFDLTNTSNDSTLEISRRVLRRSQRSIRRWELVGQG